MLDIGNVIATFFVGAIGWWLANYVGEPILSLRRIRQEIHQELYFTKNIGWVHANGKISESEKDQYDHAVVGLRRLAAKMSALSATWPCHLNWYLRANYLDIEESTKGLTGLSNGIADPAYHAQFVTQIEKALSLPRSYSEEELTYLRTEQRRRLENS